jgi:hypothetical protein
MYDILLLRKFMGLTRNNHSSTASKATRSELLSTCTVTYTRRNCLAYALYAQLFIARPTLTFHHSKCWWEVRIDISALWLCCKCCDLALSHPNDIEPRRRLNTKADFSSQWIHSIHDTHTVEIKDVHEWRAVSPARLSMIDELQLEVYAKSRDLR